MRNAGIDAVLNKPVQTGAELTNGGPVAPDLMFHHDVAGIMVEGAGWIYAPLN